MNITGEINVLICMKWNLGKEGVKGIFQRDACGKEVGIHCCGLLGKERESRSGKAKFPQLDQINLSPQA